MTRRLYSGKDFYTLKAEIKSRLSQRFPDVSLDFKNELTLFILELVSYGVESLNFFLDVQANESFPETAQLRDTMDRHAASAGYNPQGAVASSGELSVTPPANHQRAITLGRGFQWVSSRGLVYEVVEDYFWAVGDDSPKSITLSQRDTRTTVFTSDGSRFQMFDLPLTEEGEFVSYRAVTVTVDGEEWTEVDAIDDLDEDVYRVAYTASTPYIEFGDGAVGSIPPTDSEIRVEFKVTKGREGIIPAGNITNPVEPLVIAGEQVDFEVDDSTGEMSGGDGPESIEIIRAKLPRVRHADGAIVTNSDVAGLLNTYRDPVYGAVAAATAFVATSIENDIESKSLIEAIEAILEDESQTLNDVMSALDDAADGIDTHVTDIDNLVSDIESIAGSSGDIQTLVDEMRTFRADANEQANSVNERASTISAIRNAAGSAAQNAQTQSTDLRTKIGNIQTGAPDQLTGTTQTELLDLLDDLDTNLSDAVALATSGPVIEGHAQQIIASITSVKDRLNEIKGRLDGVEEKTSEIDTVASSVTTKTASLGVVASDIRAESVTLNTQIVSPWDDIESKLDALYNHLDSVFSSSCGPNLVTVPILSFDADGFYVGPSIGLMRSFEGYITERKEPSVKFRVTDGSYQLIYPTISVVFRVGRSFSANTVRGAIESNLYAVLKNRMFGQDLYLDDLYESLRSIEGVEFLNVTIDSYTPFPQDGVDIDAEGNLVVPEGNVISRPSITYFKKLPDGSKEKI